MKPIKNKNIIIGFMIVFIIFLFWRANKEDNQLEYPRPQPNPQSQSLRPTHNSDQSYSPSYHQSQPNLNRYEILQTKVKGYREETYWGSEHPIQEETRYLNDEEFDRYITEEVELKDADVYWGADYK